MGRATGMTDKNACENMKEEKKVSEQEQIKTLYADIDRYQEAIRDAQGALNAAEKELDELLAAMVGEEKSKE